MPPDDPDYTISAIKNGKLYSRKKRKLLKELELIIIDEVSMVRPDMIDFIDRALRAITGKRGKPFGGVQMLLVGDIFQLEPVVTTDTKIILSKYYPDFYFFNARAYQGAGLISIELKKIYRQNDTHFINLLDRIRTDCISGHDLKLLNSKVIGSINNDKTTFGIILTSRRDSATSINNAKMKALPGKEYVYKGIIMDDFPEKNLPTDRDLTLKKDAQVMIIRNDKEKRWVNGTIAKIVDISENSISVKLETGSIVKIEREEWQNINYIYDEKEKRIKEVVLGTFVQYPLKSAWALTIHKSQGLTFNNVTIDLGGGAFSAGQTYVALSRCRSLEGLHFLTPVRSNDIIMSRGASIFSKKYNDNQAVEKVLRTAEGAKLSRKASGYFEKGDFINAIETLWQSHCISGILNESKVRRFLSRYLSLIKSLRKELGEKNRILKKLSEEFTSNGEICLKNSDFKSALYNFKKACDLDPANKRCKFGLAEAFITSGQIQKANKIIDELIESDKKWGCKARMLKGEILESAGNLSGAVMQYQAILNVFPEDKEVITRLISAYERGGLDEFADAYRELL